MAYSAVDSGYSQWLDFLSSEVESYCCTHNGKRSRLESPRQSKKQLLCEGCGISDRRQGAALLSEPSETAYHTANNAPDALFIVFSCRVPSAI